MIALSIIVASLVICNMLQTIYVQWRGHKLTTELKELTENQHKEYNKKMDDYYEQISAFNNHVAKMNLYQYMIVDDPEGKEIKH